MKFACQWIKGDPANRPVLPILRRRRGIYVIINYRIALLFSDLIRDARFLTVNNCHKRREHVAENWLASSSWASRYYWIGQTLWSDIRPCGVDQWEYKFPVRRRAEGKPARRSSSSVTIISLFRPNVPTFSAVRLWSGCPNIRAIRRPDRFMCMHLSHANLPRFCFT